MPSLPLPLASYVLPSPSASCSRLLNCFVEEPPPRGMKSDAILRRSPGIRSWVDLTDTDGDTCRGGCRFQGTLYLLVGTQFQSLSENGTATVIGTVPGGERVRVVNNGDRMVIWRPFDNSLYQSDGSTVAQITDPMVTDGGAASPDFVDGFIVVRRPDSDEFFHTGLNALTWNGLDIAAVEGKPGRLVGLRVDNREVILQKADSTELWYNAANEVGSAFSRSPSGFINLGTVSGESLNSQDNSPFWIANDLTVRRLAAYTPERVSQHGIEAILARVQLSDSYAVPHFVEGHLLIAWVCPFASRTLVYDCTTKQWHERDSLGYGAWRVTDVIQVYGDQVVLDRTSGKVGILDADTFDEFDEPQRVQWTYQPIYAEAALATHNRFEIVPTVGKGTVIGQGMNPMATLRISDDGGETFRTNTTQSLGALGQYRTRVPWWKLGSSRNRVYQVQVTDPVQLFAFDTQVDVIGARS